MSDSDLMFRPARRARRDGALGGGLRTRAGRDLARADRGAEPRAERVRGGRRRARARGGRRRSRPGDERPFAGVPMAIKNNRPVEGLRLTYGCALMAENMCELRPQRHASPEGRRLRDRRHDHAARVRHPARQRGAHLRPDAQPVGPRTHARRLLRRRGCGRRQRHAAGRARQRRRRLDAHPRRVLRAGRAEAEPRAHLGGPRAGRLLAGHRRHAHAHGRRHRRDPRRARRLRAGRRDLGAAARRAVRARAPRPQPGTAADRRDDALADPGRRRRPDVRPGRRRRRRAAALARARGRGGRAAVAGGRAARAVRRRLLQPHRAVDRLLGRRRRARADRRGHGADELGDLLDDPPAGRDRRHGRRGRACSRSRAAWSRSSTPTTRC